MLNKMIASAAGIGVFAVVIAMGISPPPDIASAQGGYTYTQRYCAELGRQPRYYNIRDGQAAYNGGNSDSGWLIVQERGPYRVADISYSVSSSGAFVRHVNGSPYARFIPDANGNPQIYARTSGLGGIAYNPNSVTGQHAKVEPGTPGAQDGEYLWVKLYDSSPYYRYQQNITTNGGLYIRWAYIDWCN